MSQDQRPAPIQPPVVTYPTDSMAQVQLPPEFSASRFHGLPESQPHQEPALPPIHNAQIRGQLNYEGTRLPPIQLPPIDLPPQASTNASITNLLSRDPESPRHRRLNQWPPPPSQAPRPPYHSPSGHLSVSPNEVTAQIPPRPPPPPHYFNGPPRPLRTSAPFLQSQQQPQPHWGYASTSLEPEQAQHSPATSTHSFNRGYYSSSSEPSPSTAVAPAFPIPPPRRVSQPPPFDYKLNIRQQPVAARACGFGERDRRVIDPPPILELKITDRATGAPEQDPNAMLALHCTLLSHDGKEDETEVPPQELGMPSTRRLMGTLVASPYQAKDEHGIAGTFFVFPDLSCRSPGKYRLRYKLLRVDPTNMTPGAVHGSVASIVTDIFSVYSAKDFPGMRASSALLKSLRRQGLNVGVKKGSEARKGRGKGKKDNGSDDDEDNSDGDANEENGSGESDSGKEISPKTNNGKKSKRRKRES